MTTIKNIIADEKKRMDAELKLKNRITEAVTELINETKDENSFSASSRLTGEYSVNLSVWTRDDNKFASIRITKGVDTILLIIATPNMESDNTVNITEYKSNVSAKADLDRLYNMIKEL
jgi:hypothetical protein